MFPDQLPAQRSHLAGRQHRTLARSPRRFQRFPAGGTDTRRGDMKTSETRLILVHLG